MAKTIKKTLDIIYEREFTYENNKRELLIERFKGKWINHMIWCPSQCYYKFKYKGKRYEIYLRWRHTDPWTATLIEVDSDEWYDLDISFWADSEHEQCKIESIKKANEFLNKNF